MRFAAFLVGVFAVLLLMAVGYWVFLTVQFPAGPINVLMDYTGQRWLVQAVLAATVFTLVGTIVATVMTCDRGWPARSSSSALPAGRSSL